MMTTKEIQSTGERIIRSLDQRELKTAFDLLHILIADGRTYLFRDEINEQEETYKRLLYYYAAGSKDQMQDKIYTDLLASVYELTNKITHKMLSVISPKLYYATLRIVSVQPITFVKLIHSIREASDLQNRIAMELTMNKLFKEIWTSVALSEEDANGLLDSLLNRTTTPDAANSPDDLTILNCQIVSALTLGLQEFFDRRKMILLIHAAESDDENVKIRAYTGLLLTLYRHKNQIDCYPEIGYRIENLMENTEFYKIVNVIILRFILSRETEKISKKMKDEILPEMMKLRAKFYSDAPSKDSPVDPSDLELNPEWMEKLSNSPISKKMEEFSKLQEEGADVMHLTFVHLKEFPFFRDINNWFMPFHKGLPVFSGHGKLLKAIETIVDTGLMCNSDLYSFFFSLMQIPEDQLLPMVGHLESQLSEWKQQEKSELQTPERHTTRIAGRYVQDLYRFYKLYHRRSEFEDIFLQNLDFHNLPVLQFYDADVNHLLSIADYYLGKNYAGDALVIYNRLSDTIEWDEMLFQKKGYCFQMEGDYPNALAEYGKAELINPDSKWLLRHTAQCHRAAGQTQKALDYYFHLEKTDPENLPVLLNIGSCYLEMKNYPEALKYYFKVDYLNQHGSKAWRPIAWCSFLVGKYDQARNYYSKIISHNPEYHDYINAGHTEWVLQNIASALDFYKKSIQTAGQNFETFHTTFTSDIPELLAAGITRNEMDLLLDQLRYLCDLPIQPLA